MSPSITARRAGFVTAGALALSLSGATAAGPASALTLCSVGQVLNSAGVCVKKTVTSVTPAPTKSSSSGTGSTGGTTKLPVPSLPKVPLPTGSSSGGGGSSDGGSSSGSGDGVTLPKLPTVKLPSGSTGDGTGSVTDGDGLSGPSVPGTGTTTTTTATKDGSSVPGAQPADPAGSGGGGMLSPASAFLPTTGILGFTTFSGTGVALIPTLSSLSAVPSPLLASQLASQPAAQLAAVQAPLLAAGEAAGSGGSSSTVLTSFGGYALPGLLVVLATAVVGVVGAGNVRVWQARFAARRS